MQTISLYTVIIHRIQSCNEHFEFLFLDDPWTVLTRSCGPPAGCLRQVEFGSGSPNSLLLRSVSHSHQDWRNQGDQRHQGRLDQDARREHVVG